MKKLSGPSLERNPHDPFAPGEPAPDPHAAAEDLPETPPEVRQLIEEKWGLDRPAHERYAKMMRNLLVPQKLCDGIPQADALERGADKGWPDSGPGWFTCPVNPKVVALDQKHQENLEAEEAGRSPPHTEPRDGWPSGLAAAGSPWIGVDFGRSIFQERPVFEIILEALPNTIILSLVSLLIIQIVGIVLGTIQAMRQYTATDASISVVSLFFYSMPRFWLALMLQLIFALMWPILPSSGMTDAVMHEYMTGPEQLWDYVKHLILPGCALGIASAAGIARYMRSSLLEVIRQDFMRTARAKGLPELTVTVKHGMRNALLPIITILGLYLPWLFSGSVLVEQIFAWPGMGRLIVEAIFTQDTPVIIACFFVFSLIVVAGNLLADILYAVVDPRIRYS